ncbi:MAG: hypothetical protein AAGA69_00420, partial [Pseudomonadota bacterium]
MVRLLALLSLLILPAACATYGYKENPELPTPVIAPTIDPATLEQETEVIEAERRRPSRPVPEDEIIELNPGALPAPLGQKRAILPVPDRWRLVEAIGVEEKWYDPYNQNTLKGDRPILG